MYIYFTIKDISTGSLDSHKIILYTSKILYLLTLHRFYQAYEYII